jgi:hypothetical protein
MIETVRIGGPGLTAQELNRHGISRIEFLNLDRNVDQAVGLDH